MAKVRKKPKIKDDKEIVDQLLVIFRELRKNQRQFCELNDIVPGDLVSGFFSVLTTDEGTAVEKKKEGDHG